jgi:DNA-binding SARP family transcriptional activator
LRRRLRSRASAVPFAPPKLTIQTLGRAQVLLNGKPVNVPEWQNQKRVRETFYCLLCHPDGLTRDALGLILWPESSPAQLRLQFKNTMYRLRSALGQEAIQYDGERYWFNRQQDYEYDIEVFSQKLEQAKQAPSAEGQIQALRAAVEAYRGEFLPEIDGTWVVPEREKLRQAFIDAAHSLARRYLETGKYRLVIEVCQRVLAEDECLEEAHRLAMRAYAALGDRAAVARQFIRCSKALEQEINTTPSSQTISLYQELRQ